MKKILTVAFSLLLGAGVVNADNDMHDKCGKAGSPCCNGVMRARA
jgi:hypothetical protein